MNILLVGIVIFFGIHLVSYTPLRTQMVERLGEGPWKGVFSLISIVGLGLMIWGYERTRSGPDAANILYYPPDWARHATMLLVLLGFISLAASFHKGRLKLWLKNPMSIGFALWALGHLLSNGKVAAVWFFGSFLVFSLLDIAVNSARGHQPAYVPKPRHDLITVAAGVILYVVFLYGFHPYVLNLPVAG